MKKTLIALAAIVMAIGLNAFTVKKPVVADSKAFANYYWYQVNAAGQTTSTVLDATQRSKAFAMANLVPSCADTPTKPNCALGSGSATLTVGTTISNPPADAIILRTN